MFRAVVSRIVAVFGLMICALLLPLAPASASVVAKVDIASQYAQTFDNRHLAIL